jgi:hypothetical protein
MIPEIRIQFSWLLAEGPSKVLEEKYNQGHRDNYTTEGYEKWAAKYRKAWQKHERKVLRGMCDVLGLEFRQTIIDVSLAPWFSPISAPLIIGFQHEPDQFVDVLTHELLHVLLTDNNVLSVQNKAMGDVDLLTPWSRLFGKRHSFNTLVHIPVHAGCKHMYLDVWHEPTRLERDMQYVADWPDYKAAWDYVESHDYKDILKKLKESYRNYETK